MRVHNINDCVRSLYIFYDLCVILTPPYHFIQLFKAKAKVSVERRCIIDQKNIDNSDLVEKVSMSLSFRFIL